MERGSQFIIHCNLIPILNNIIPEISFQIKQYQNQ